MREPEYLPETAAQSTTDAEAMKKTLDELKRILQDRIYLSCEEANNALGPCPHALAESDGGHWWYTDPKEYEGPESSHSDYLWCVCKTCPQRMKLSIDAEEYPL